jgi:hypothetical protein
MSAPANANAPSAAAIPTALAKPDPDDAHRQAQRDEPRRGLLVVGADRAQPGEHERERAGEADDRRDEARQHRLERAGLALAHRSATG